MSSAQGNEDSVPSEKRLVSVNNNPQPYRPDVDGLRAIAVLSVIGFHASRHWVPGGFVGVDIFFVISGFLISGIIFKGLDQGEFSFATFYARRIRRIFPALIIVLLAVWAIGWVALMADEYKDLGESIAAGSGFVSNIFLWRQSGYFNGGGELKPLLHLWSLGVEEQYYLLWPLAVFLVWKAGLKPQKFILSVLMVSFALNIGTVGLSPESAFYLPHTRFWELMIGSTLACIQLYKKEEFDSELIRIFYISRWRAHLQEIKAWVGILLIAAAVALVNEQKAFPGCWALLPTLGAFLLISAEQTAWINRKLLGNRLMVFIGLISYPLYLWHWPLLSYTRIILGEPSAKIKLAAVALAFLLAWLTYQLVEKPVSRSQSGREAMAVPVLISAMLVVVGLGVLNIRADGMPGRYPDAIQQLTHYKADDHVPLWRADKCFLYHNRDGSAFDPTCVDLEPKGSPLVFLWGDSHAADLYPGLRQLRSSYHFRIAQYTTGSCPPVLNLNFDAPRREFCRGTNDWIWRKIIELQPETVVLSAQFWFLDSPGMHESFSSTLAALKKSGVKTIVVVGPNPKWQDSLPRSLFLNYYRAGSLHTIPERMTYDLDDSVFTADQQLKTWASDADAIYLSPVSVLCNQDGCMTKVQENGKTDLTTFDNHHFTEIASEYVGRLMFTPLFGRVLASEKPLGEGKP